MNKREEMRQMKEGIVAMSGELADERRKNGVLPVVGEGDHDAVIMFVGEAPGKNEAASGRPFCGASGRVLDELMSSVDLRREDVFITNIVKDRPTENRDPDSDEIELYGPYLNRQFEIIQPKVIATLGRFSMDYVMRHFKLDDEIDKISKVHGKHFEVKAPWGGSLFIAPLYHPAVAIYNRKQKGLLEKDIESLLSCLK